MPELGKHGSEGGWGNPFRLPDKLINEFLKDSTNIRLHFLPPYAPDINPVELFNNALKSNIRYEKAMNSEELIEFVQNYMNEKEKDNEYVKQFFNGKEVQYAKSA